MPAEPSGVLSAPGGPGFRSRAVAILDLEGQDRLCRQLEPAVEARLVIEELHPTAGGPGLLDLNRKPEPAVRPENREVEAEGNVELGPAGWPGGRGVREVGEVGGRIDGRGINRGTLRVQVTLEEPETDLARVGGSADALGPEVEGAVAEQGHVETGPHRKRDPFVDRLHAGGVGV